MTESKKKQLSLEPYKGTRDFYPEDQFVQNYIFSVMRNVVESYGYLEYGSTILEETDLYRAKTGEEIINEQTYTFTDRGGRDVTIRPEMTPTVARMVAQKRRELNFPLRWYSIPNLFRYERPQRGRLREHWQLNADIFGVDSVDADVEIICLANDIMKAYGAKAENFEIRVNDRRLMDDWFTSKYGITQKEIRAQVNRILDRKRKITEAEFKNQLKPIFQDKYEALRTELDMDIDSFVEMLNTEKNHLAIINLRDKLKQRGIENIKFDATLTRGFDYYTGIVFEVFDQNPQNPRSLFGGGRYDDLVGIFGVEKVTGVGFGMGDVTIRDYLETYGLLPQYKPQTHLYIAPFNESFIDFSNKLASELRSQGINVAVDLTSRKVSAKVKTADREKIPYVLVVGEEEVKNDKFKIKNLKESKEFVVDRNKISSVINRS